MVSPTGTSQQGSRPIASQEELRSAAPSQVVTITVDETGIAVSPDPVLLPANHQISFECGEGVEVSFKETPFQRYTFNKNAPHTGTPRVLPDDYKRYRYTVESDHWQLDPEVIIVARR